MKSRRLLTALAGAIAVSAMVTGCSSDGGSNSPRGQESTPHAAAPEADNALAAARPYFDALAASTPDSLAQAVELATPGSGAEAYATHMQYSVQAQVDGGDDLGSGEVKKLEAGYSVCFESDCTDMTSIKVAGGKVASFDLAGVDVSTVAAVGVKRAVKLGNLGSAEVVASFLGPVSHTLFVTVKFTSPPNKTITTSYVSQYRGPDKHQVDNVDQLGSTTLQPDSIVYNTFTFKNSKLGGSIAVKVANEDFDSQDVAVSKSLKTVAG